MTLALSLVAAGEASAQAVVRTSIASGNPALPGSTFDISVDVDNNTTGFTPVAANFRVVYPTDSVSFVGVVDGDLGTALAGPEEGAAPSRFRDIGTLGNGANIDPNPQAFVLRFQVNNTPANPYTITVGDDPDAGIALLSDGFAQNVPHVFNNSGTTAIAPVLGTTTVSTSVISGNPTQPGGTFAVAVDVTANSTGLLPAGAAFRVGYDASKVALLSADEADLGPADIGVVDGAGAGASRDVATLGNLANSDSTPRVYTLNFQVLPGATGSYSIVVSDDPDASANLLATDAATDLPVNFDNTQTAGLSVITAPAEIATSVVLGDPTVPGSSFTVAVDVTDNTTGFTPAAAAFRVGYDSSKVTLDSVTDGDLGPADLGPVEGVGAATVRDVATLGNVGNADSTPRVYLLNFSVLPGAAGSYSIVVSDDPDASATLLATDASSSIPHVFDNSATTGVSVVPAGQAIVAGSVIAGDPTLAGSSFTVAVDVTANTTAFVPGAAAFRVTYNADKVSLDGVASADLGLAELGVLEGAGAAAFRDLATLGDLSNLDPTPRVALLTFSVLPGATGAYAITLSDDPDAGLKLAATDAATEVAHIFDNSATSFVLPIAGEATLATSIVSGDATVAGSTFSVAVDVASNTTSFTPAGAALRVAYDAAFVEFLGVNDGDLGQAVAGPQQSAGPVTFRDVATLGNIGNGNALPRVFTLNFRVLDGVSGAYSIEVSNDPDAVVALLATDAATSIPTLFDNSATDPIVAVDNTPQATIATAITAGDPTAPGTQFTVQVSVSDNPTSFTPAGAALRISYNTDFVTFVSVADGDLGPATASSEEGVGPTVSRDIATLGDLANVNNTPVVYELTFAVNPGVNGSYSITLGDDPDAGAQLLATDGVTNIRRIYDSSATTNLMVALTPVTVATGFAGVPSVGDTFDVTVDITSNSTGLVPAAAAFRVSYDAMDLEFVSVADGELGPTTASAEEGAGAGAFRDVATLGDISNSNATPRAFTLTFRVLPTADGSSFVRVSNDPDAGSNLLAVDAVTEIPSTFSNLATDPITINIVPPDPAVVVLSVSGDCTASSSVLSAEVSINPNPTGLTPVAAAFRINFDADSLTFVGVQDGDLGTTEAGPVEGSGVNSFVDIATLGNGANGNATPVAFTALFEVNAVTNPSYSISVVDDPDAGVNLLASDFATEINHIFGAPFVCTIPGPATIAGAAPVSVNVGDSFTVDVAVTANPSGFTPVAAALRISYDSSLVELVSIADADLGPAFLGPVEGAAPAAFRDAATNGNAINADLTPGIYTLTFNALAAGNATISLGSDPDAGATLLANDFSTDIPVLFASPTVEILAIPTPTPTATPVPTTTPIVTPTVVPTTTPVPTPTVVPTTTPVPTPTVVPTTTPIVTPTVTPTPTPALTVSTSLTTSDVCTTGTAFGVVVAITDNPLGVNPIAANLRVYYNSADVALQAPFVTSAELGTASASLAPEIGNGPNGTDRFIDVTTAGSFGNTNPTPVAFTVNFTRLSGGLGNTFSIVVAEDPAALGDGILDNTFTGLPFVIDNSATIDLCPVVTPTVTPTPVVTIIPTTTPTPTPVVTIIPTTTPTPTATPIPQAVIASSVVAGDTCSSFTVAVAVASNTTGQVPVGASLRVYFDAALTVGAASAGDLGDVVVGPVTASGNPGLPANYVDVAVASNVSNTNATPAIFTLDFTNTAGAGTFSVLVADDPAANGSNLIDVALASINHVFNNAATTDLVCAVTPTVTPTVTPIVTPTTVAPTITPIVTPTTVAPTPTVTVTPTSTVTPTATPIPVAVIASSIVSGDPCDLGTSFTVSIDVASNTTGETPIGANVRVYFDSASVAYVSGSVAGIDLGDAIVGPVESSVDAGLPDSFIDILTTSNVANSDLTPGIATLQFVSLASAVPAFDIILADDPASNGNGLINGSFAAMIYAFDSSATTDLCPGIVTPSPTPVVTPTTVAPTVTFTPTITPVVTPTTVAPTITPVVTPTTVAPTITPVVTPTTVAPTITPVVTPTTVAPTITPVVTPTTVAPTVTFTPTITPVVTIIPTTTPTPTPVVTISPTATPIVVPTTTPTPTAVPTTTPIATLTPVVTATVTPIVTATATPIVTATATPVVTATATATATATPTATVTPTVTPLPTATPGITFDFTPEDQDDPTRRWNFQLIPVFNDSVTSGYDPETTRLSISALTNNRSFGTWQSPVFQIGADPADVPASRLFIAGTVGSQSLYRTTWVIGGDATVAQDLLPTVRVRSSSFDNQQTDELSITSQGNGAYSPTPEGREYVQFFSQPDTENRFRLNFDVLSFLTDNAPVASVFLDRVTVEYLGVDAVVAPTTPALAIDFTATTDTLFTARNAAPFIEAPSFMAATERGLAIRGLDSLTTGTVHPNQIFGFWGNESQARFTTGTLYRVSWKVGSNAAADQTLQVPTFRLRVNSFNNQFAALKQVNSWREAAMVPLEGASQTYSTWMQAPAEIAGNRWIFSFDYLYVPYPVTTAGEPDMSQDNPTITLYLEELTVEEYLIP